MDVFVVWDRLFFILDNFYFCSHCVLLQEFDRQAASTVNQHFEEFESMLFEGPKETVSNVYRECQEWVTQFPHLR